MMQKIVQFLLKHEGLRLNAYYDPGSKDGLPITIGIGSTFYEDGSPIKMGDKITRERALKLAETVALNKLLEVKRIIKVPQNENQFIALTSLCYNIGSGALAKTQLVKMINDRRPINEIVERWKVTYITPKSVREGLMKRRADEAALYSKI